MKIEQLHEKRGQIWERAKEIMDKAEAEGRSLSEEERGHVNTAFADMDKIKGDIEIAERAAEARKIMDSSMGAKAGLQMADDVKQNDTYRGAFWKAMNQTRNALNNEEYRALSVGTAEDGGYTVPDEFERQLIQALEDVNVMRGLATVIQTSSGTREIPVVTDRGTAFWTAEKGAYTESDHEFDQETLSAYKLTTLMKVTEELLNDSAFNLEAYIAGQYAIRIGSKEEEAFVAGDGTGKPTGILVSGAAGHETAATGAITADELFQHYHSLRRPYRARASWLMADSTVLAVRLLKADTDGQYLWQPGLQAGQPDRLLGRPVFTSDFVEEIGAGKKIAAFGDMSYYWIADRTQTVIQRLNELYAANGFVGFRAFKRVDGKLILPEAVKILKMKA
jgi:HK97 family phage major capsid protein